VGITTLPAHLNLVGSPNIQLHETNVTKLMIKKYPQFCGYAVCWLIPLSFKYFSGHFCSLYIIYLQQSFLKEITVDNNTKQAVKLQISTLS
jgi:hypothetical protein